MKIEQQPVQLPEVTITLSPDEAGHFMAWLFVTLPMAQGVVRATGREIAAKVFKELDALKYGK